MVVRILFFLQIILVFSNVTAADKVVLTTALGPPLSLTNDKGFVDEVVSEALLRNGISLEVSHLPAERALINANNGTDDGDLNRIAGLSKFYPNLIQIPEKTFSMEFVAFSHKKNISISDWSALKSYTVGLITGWKILERNIPKNVDVTKVKNAQQLFSLLENNRVDVILYGKWQGLYYIKKNNLKDVKLLQPTLSSKDMHVYFHKKNKHLVPLFTKSLRDMKKEGVYDSIYKTTLLPLTQ